MGTEFLFRLMKSFGKRESGDGYTALGLYSVLLSCVLGNSAILLVQSLPLPVTDVYNEIERG